jgi:hypothetical protein
MHQGSEEKKLTTILDYWIQHNVGHAREFREWAEKARSLGQTAVCEHILQAAEQMDKANECLRSADEKLKET